MPRAHAPPFPAPVRAQDAPSRVAWEESGPAAPLRTERLWGATGPLVGGLPSGDAAGSVGCCPGPPRGHRPCTLQAFSGALIATTRGPRARQRAAGTAETRRVGVAPSSRHVHPLGPPPAAGKPPRARAVRGGSWTGHFRRSAESSWARGAVLDLSAGGSGKRGRCGRAPAPREPSSAGLAQPQPCPWPQPSSAIVPILPALPLIGHVISYLDSNLTN